METFFESFRSMGVAAGSCNSSNQSLICSEVVTTSGQACRAAQRFVKAKNLLRTKRFRCDLFDSGDSGDIGDAEVPCDVKDAHNCKQFQEIHHTVQYLCYVVFVQRSLKNECLFIFCISWDLWCRFRGHGESERWVAALCAAHGASDVRPGWVQDVSHGFRCAAQQCLPNARRGNGDGRFDRSQDSYCTNTGWMWELCIFLAEILEWTLFCFASWIAHHYHVLLGCLGRGP